MSDTQKVILGEDEDSDSIYIDAMHEVHGATEQELTDYGIYVPVELIDEQVRLNGEWREHQKQLLEWFEAWLPKDDEESERIRELVLYQARTWGQLGNVDSCEHVEAIAVLGDPDRHFASCDLCGSSVSREHKRNDDGDLVPTGELRIR